MTNLPVTATEDASALWHSLLQEAMRRASHDVKDTLNGVSVNLEVIRSRAGRADLPASALAQFGEAAGNQLERLTALLDALLALSRVEREPADILVITRRLSALLSASSSSNDPCIRLVDKSGQPATTTRVDATTVRLAIAAPLLGLVTAPARGERPADISCRIETSDGAIMLAIVARGQRALMPEQVGEIIRGAGIRVTEQQDELTLTFPRT